MINQIINIFLIYHGSLGPRDRHTYPAWVWTLSVLLPFIVFFLAVIYNYVVRKTVTPYRIRFDRFGQYFKPIPIEAEEWLARYYNWYAKLPHNLQKRFRSRMKGFMIDKNFEARGITLNPEMTWMMAATYAQLTIGLKNPWLKNLKTVVFDASTDPSKYYAKTGNMYLNWNDFQMGFINGEDGVNEGLRVLTSVMKREDKHRKILEQGSYHIFPSPDMKRWNTAAKNEFSRFTSLGLTQGRSIELEDFLSVTLVYFFEMPEKLKERHPELYTATLKLMKWDPIQKRLI